MGELLRSLYRTEKLKLQGGEIIHLTESGENYLFCGYAKGDILRRGRTQTNYAYKSEIVVLSRYMPELADMAKSDLLGGSSTFLRLNENLELDGTSNYKNINLNECSYEILGTLSKEALNLWQMKMKMIKPDFKVRAFVKKEEAYNIVMSNPSFKVNKDKDRAYLNFFNEEVLQLYKHMGADDVLLNRMKQFLVLVDKAEPCENPFRVYLKVGADKNGNILFCKTARFGGASKPYGSCRVVDTGYFLELYLGRFKAKRNR